MIKQMWKYTLLVVFCALFFSCAQEDPSSLDPSEVFIKYFGSTGNEHLIDMVQTSSSEFIILGQTNNTESGDVDFYIVKTDSAGNGIWQQKYGYDHGNANRAFSEDIPSSIRLINNDQSFLAIGTSNISDTLSIFMLNIDVASGAVNEQLIYQYEDNRPATSLEDRGFVSTSGADVLWNEMDDEFIILGSTETWSDATYLNDPSSIFLMSIPNTGDMQTASENPSWIDISGLRLEDRGVKLLEDEGRYFSLSTSTIPLGSPLGYGLRDVFIQEFNSQSGVVLNSEFYGTTDQDEATNFVAANGTLLLTGASGTEQAKQTFFARINQTLPKRPTDELKIDVVSEMGIDANGSRGMDLVRLPSGAIYVAGQLDSYTTSSGEFKENEIVVFRMDAFGTLDTENFRIMGSEDNDQANAILLRPDGALVIGATVDFGSTTMMSLFKTNFRGEFK
ncbi:hypothetical protein [Reichenbachiella ulvae]|uniref:Delta-60 repeat domain-containing protein n=1 Tax=Reichenbachiella ulvae TaxID=2980104 RepID=A0ABT3CS89_9BACT|nr:hypothetical protein [Reichenbachiella ulvae]MCV9386553.1 hypothetical protein [Reichenbachiella ulvae]